MLWSHVEEKLRSTERGRTIGKGLGVEEDFLIPILAEVEQQGDPFQIYHMLYTLFSAYCPYGATDKIRETLARMDSLGMDSLSSLVAYRLHKFNLLPDRMEDYVRRGLVHLEQQRPTRQRHWDLYLLKTLALELQCAKDPYSEGITELLNEINVLRKGVRQYTRYLLLAVEILVTAGVTYPQMPDLLRAMRASIYYLLRRDAINRDDAQSRLDTIDGLVDKLKARP